MLSLRLWTLLDGKYQCKYQQVLTTDYFAEYFSPKREEHTWDMVFLQFEGLPKDISMTVKCHPRARITDSCATALRCMPQNIVNDKSTVVQVMTWYRQTAPHYLRQCWRRSQWPFGGSSQQWVRDLVQLALQSYLWQLSLTGGLPDLD